MKNQKAFTVIEIIVVIAIIAILAAVILVNVSSSDKKGKDAAIKGNMVTLATRGAAYIERNGNYNNFCLSPDGGLPIETAIESAKISASFTCEVKSDNSAWCACSTLKNTSNTLCVDSKNYKKETSGACDDRCKDTTGACVD